MRCSGSDKAAIQLLQNSNLSIKKTLERLNIHKPTFYNWLKRYQENGIDAWKTGSPHRNPYGTRSLRSIVIPLLS